MVGSPTSTRWTGWSGCSSAEVPRGTEINSDGWLITRWACASETHVSPSSTPSNAITQRRFRGATSPPRS